MLPNNQDDRTLSARLKFSYDAKATEDAKKRILELTRRMEQLKKKADIALQGYQKAVDNDDDVTAYANALNAVYAEMDAIQEKSEELEKQIGKPYEKAAKAAKDTKRHANELRESTERLNSIFVTLGVVGGVAIGGLTLLASGYVKQVGMVEASSRRWLAATNELEVAKTRVGRMAAEAIVPWMEKAAELAEKASDFVEKHPDIVQAAVNIGGSMVAIAAIGTAVTKGIRLYSDFTYIAAVGMQKAAADKMLAAATIQAGAAGASGVSGVAGGVAGLAGGLIGKVGGLLGKLVPVLGAIASAATAILVPIAGVGVGVFGYKKIAEKFGLNELAAEQAVAAATWSATMLATLGNTEKANAAFQKVSTRLGLMADDAEEAADKIASSRIMDRPHAQEALQAYISYRQQEAAAEEQYNQQRSSIIEQYGRQMVQLEERYQSQRASLIENHARGLSEMEENYLRSREKALRDFAASEARAEADYYRNRAKTIADFGKEAERAEQDHQKRIQELRRDHEASVEDLVAGRDALGLAREMRRYEDQRQQEESSYQDEARRSSADLADRLAEMDQNFALSRQRRQADFSQRMADQEGNYQRQRAKSIENFERQLEEMDEQHEKEKEQLDAQREESLADLDEGYQKEKEKRAENLRQQLLMLEGFLDNSREIMGDWYALMAQGLQDYVNLLGSAGRLGRGLVGNDDSTYYGTNPELVKEHYKNLIGAQSAPQAAAQSGRMGAQSSYNRSSTQANLSMRIDISGSPNADQFRGIAYDAALDAFNAVMAGPG